MPAFLIPAITFLLSGFVARALIGAGLTVLTFAALEPLVETALDEVSSHLGNLSGDVLDVMLLASVDSFVAIIGGAMLTRVAIDSASVAIGLKK